MDDKFNQWCMNVYKKHPDTMNDDELNTVLVTYTLYMHELRINKLDAEIDELKRRIEALETPKNV